jgi:hypothetical protein
VDTIPRGIAKPSVRQRRIGPPVLLRESKNMSKNQLFPQLYFSYSQFLLYDCGVKSPGCVWTKIHYAQGFTRRESVVSFGTLLEFGFADISYTRGPFQPQKNYERAIAVPFVVSTGRVIIDGPEEINIQRFIELPTGNYAVTAAQLVTTNKKEIVDLFFESRTEPLKRSAIIVADNLLNPTPTLIETAEMA